MKKILIIFGVIVALIIGGALVVRTLIYPLKYKAEIQKYSKEYNVEPELIAAIIHVRSFFDPKEYQKNEACGPMAIQGESAEIIAKEMGFKDFKVEKLADPDVNIKIGTWFIANHYKNKDIKELVKNLGGISWQHAKPNTKEEKSKKWGEDYYEKYFVEKVKERAKMYKLLYPTL